LRKKPHPNFYGFVVQQKYGVPSNNSLPTAFPEKKIEAVVTILIGDPYISGKGLL